MVSDVNIKQQSPMIVLTYDITGFSLNTGLGAV
jgi:hypothetical protein